MRSCVRRDVRDRLRRHPDHLPPAIHPLAADLAEPSSLRALPEVDAVVYAAAAVDISQIVVDLFNERYPPAGGEAN